tara:strand:+ start:204723 stop:205685 length:963 start_codon:yes stop_codon:yes gene_type:complete
MKYILLFILSTQAYCQVDIFQKYLDELESGKINRSNVVDHLVNYENRLYSEINSYFDELAFVMDEKNFISLDDRMLDDYQNWNKHLKDHDIKKILNEIAQDPSVLKKNPQYIKALKENRKYAHFIRQSFTIFDSKHSPPKSVNKFVKTFGKLNDAILAENAIATRELANKCSEALAKIKKKKVLKAYNPVSKKELNNYLSKVKSNTQKILNAPTHSVDDFHTIRKEYKKFLHLYYNLEDHTPMNKYRMLNDYITKLGELNDVYTDIKFRLNIDLEAYEIQFPKRVNKLMIEAYDYMEEDLRFIELGQSCYSNFKPKAFIP